MKILIFTEGTLLMPPTFTPLSQPERVMLSNAGGPVVKNFRQYIPISHAVSKLKNWVKQGAIIHYLSSAAVYNIEDVNYALKNYHFPTYENLHYRKSRQNYARVAEELMPDILIEDNCESIGGEAEMTFPHLAPEIKSKIRSIVTPEFSGIDHLPDDTSKLFS